MIVTDKQGRQRFHGAFTGGFSAGHYMTVGTEEGWTPGKFVSSRDRKDEAQSGGYKVQRPEDFMDEDDDFAMGRRLGARSGYAGPELQSRQRQRHLDEASGSAATSGLVGIPSELIAPTSATIGEKLMHAMGWRRGHGVGPRRMNKDTGTYSIPSDTAIRDVVAKNDAYGVGYTSLRPNQFFNSSSGGGVANNLRLLNVNQKHSASLGAAVASGFGLGALEEVGDDAAAFALDDKSQYHTVLGGDDDEDDEDDAYFHALGERQRRSQRGSASASMTASERLKQKMMLQIAGRRKHGQGGAGAARGEPRCHDGRAPLDGFELAREVG